MHSCARAVAVTKMRYMRERVCQFDIDRPESLAEEVAIGATRCSKRSSPDLRGQPNVKAGACHAMPSCSRAAECSARRAV